MSNKSGELFRKSMSGYNKKDVNEYIEAASIRAQKREAEFESRIADLENTLKAAEERANIAESRDFSEEKAVYEKQIAELKSEHEKTLGNVKGEYDGKISEITEKLAEGEKIIEAQTEYIEKLKDAVAKLKDELESSRETIDAYEKKNSEASALTEKASKYDNLSSQIGELMLSAGNTAEHIIKDAKCKAAEIIADADKKSNDALGVLQKYTEKYCDRLGEVTAASAKERLNRIHREMAEFEASVNRSIADAQNSTSPMNIHIENLRNSLETSLDTILNRNGNSGDGAPLEEKEANELLERAVNDILSKLNEELRENNSAENL